MFAGTGLLLLAASSVPFVVGHSASAADESISTRQGEIGGGQSVDALDARDQIGTADDWTSYVEFTPDDGGRHVSILEMNPEGEGSDTLSVDVDYRGPSSDENVWTLSVRDRDANTWVDVFVNDDVTEWEWSPSSVTLDDARRFLDGSGRAKLRFGSSNDVDVSQLDAVALTVADDTPPTPSSTPAPPTAPTAAPITAPPATSSPPAGMTLPPTNGGFDYQIGSDYPVPAGVGTVSRDWFGGQPAAGLYNVCYVNAFQTQDDDPDVDRPDERANWPAAVVLTSVATDPDWEGEYLIDTSTPEKRATAAAHVAPMIQTCADKGFDAVEFDNLDSWTRFEDFPTLQARVPFDRDDNIAFATTITEQAHQLGLAVAQKNTSDLIDDGAHVRIGFDFAISEECGVYAECGVFADAYADNVLDVEYDDSPENLDGFATACSGYRDRLSIVLRDRNVVSPVSPAYVRAAC